MSSKRDLLVRIDTQFQDKGFKSAEQSARVLQREMAKLEAEERQLANMQMAAMREAEARRAAQLANMERVGRAATMMGAAIALGLGLAGKAAMDWESAWAGVTKTVDGSDEQMAALEGQLRSLARTLPATHEEIAGVAEAAGQLGVKRQDVASFTKTMIDLGVSTNLSSDQAATGLARLNNIMGVTNDQVGRAGAAIVDLGNNFATTEAEILEMSLRIAGAGHTIGMTQADVMGFAAALSSVGIEAEMGGSAISRVFVDIANAVDTGGESLDKIAGLAGMTGAQFKQAFERDAAGAVVAMIAGLGKLDSQGISTFQVLDDLGWGNIRLRDTLLRASGAGDMLREAVETSNVAYREQIALVEEANKRYATSESRVKIARNELNDAAIDIGAVVLPALAGVADRVGAMASAFRELPDWVKTSVAVLGSVASATLLVGGAALMLIPKLVTMNATLAASGPAGAKAAAGMRALGGAMAGPLGLAVAGATIVFGLWMDQQLQAQQRVRELSDTLDQQTGAITENSRAWAVSALSDDGILEAASALGLSLEQVTDAALGNADAHREVEAALDAIIAKQKDPGLNLGEYADLIGTRRKVEAVREALQGQNETLEEARQRTQEKAAALGEDAAASDKAASSSEVLTGALGDVGDAAADAEAELNALIKAVEGFGDVTASAMEAASAYQAAIDKATASLKENGVAVNKSRTAFNLNTEAGRSNQAALLDIADSALKSATANFRNGASVGEVSKQIDSARGRFIEMATRMGLNETAAKRLADQLGLTRGNVGQLGSAVNKLPPSKTITIKTIGVEQSISGVGYLRQQITNLQGKTVTVRTRFVYDDPGRPGRPMGGGLTQADGGVVDYFASGGIKEDHRAQIAPAGSWRVWAEPETGGEGYIPLAPSKRPTSIPVWFEVGRRLGVLEQAQRVAPGAWSGFPQAGPTQVDRSVSVTAYGHTAEEVAREIRQAQLEDEALNPDWG